MIPDLEDKSKTRIHYLGIINLPDTRLSVNSPVVGILVLWLHRPDSTTLKVPGDITRDFIDGKKIKVTQIGAKIRAGRL